MANALPGNMFVVGGGFLDDEDLIDDPDGPSYTSPPQYPLIHSSLAQFGKQTNQPMPNPLNPRNRSTALFQAAGSSAAPSCVPRHPPGALRIVQREEQSNGNGYFLPCVGVGPSPMTNGNSPNIRGVRRLWEQKKLLLKVPPVSNQGN